MHKNPVLSSIIMGAISIVLNVIMVFSLFSTGSFRYGGIFIIIPISGIISGFSGLKQGGVVGSVIGIVLNAIGAIGALGFILLGILF